MGVFVHRPSEVAENIASRDVLSAVICDINTHMEYGPTRKQQQNQKEKTSWTECW